MLFNISFEIDIENILPQGFDFRGHRQNPLRTKWHHRELVADIYLSRGTEMFDSGRYQQALHYYEWAIKFNPHYEKAHVNKAIVLSKIDMG